jgi:hypothetical protein
MPAASSLSLSNVAFLGSAGAAVPLGDFDLNNPLIGDSVNPGLFFSSFVAYWDALPGATGYRIYVSVTSTFSPGTLVLFATVSGVTELTITRAELGIAEADTRYVWVTGQAFNPVYTSTGGNLLYIESGVVSPTTYTYLRPNGVDTYHRPGGTDIYLRP